MIKYLTYYGTSHSNKITAVEIERETETSVWIDGQRRQKRSSYENYWDTWDEAYAHILGKAERKAVSARIHLNTANNELDSIKSITKPE